MLPSDPLTISLSLPLVVVLGTLVVLGAVSCALTLVELVIGWRDERAHARMVRHWMAEVERHQQDDLARRRRQQTPVDFTQWK